jgi:hypothetical protein
MRCGSAVLEFFVRTDRWKSEEELQRVTNASRNCYNKVCIVQHGVESNRFIFINLPIYSVYFAETIFYVKHTLLVTFWYTDAPVSSQQTSKKLNILIA